MAMRLAHVGRRQPPCRAPHPCLRLIFPVLALVTIKFLESHYIASTTTDSLGTYRFQDVPVIGSFILEASAADGSGAVGSAQGFVSAGVLMAMVDIVLDFPGSGSLSGIVLTSAGTQVVEGALVSYLFPETGLTGSKVTDASGMFSFSGIAADGTVVLVGFEQISAASDSLSTFLTPSSLSQDVVLSVQL